MAKGSGGTRTKRPERASSNTDSRQRFTDDATKYAQELMGKSIDYNDRDDKRLRKQLQQLVKPYPKDPDKLTYKESHPEQYKKPK